MSRLNTLAFCVGVLLLGQPATAQPALLTEQQVLGPGDPLELQAFGRTISLDGTTLVIGASGDSTLALGAGAAYVFDRIDGDWVEVQKLLASDGAYADGFGATVSVSGDRVAIGAYYQNERGAVYISDRADGTWAESAKLAPAGLAPSDAFGQSIVLRGDRLLVGAPGDDEAAGNAGAAYVFEWDGAEWNMN